MKVTESIFKSFFEKKTLKPKTQWVPFVPRAPRPWESWQKQCLPGKWRRWWFRGGGSSGKEREWSSWHAGSLKKHDEFQLFTHCSTAGPVQPEEMFGQQLTQKKIRREMRKRIWSNEFRHIGTGDEWICRGFLESDWVLLLKPNLKLRKSAMSERLFQEKVAYMRFHDQVHLCCAGLDFGISGWFEQDQSIQIVSNDKNQRVMKASFFFIQWRFALIFTGLAQLATLVHMNLIGNRQLAIRKFKRQKIPTLLY